MSEVLRLRFHDTEIDGIMSNARYLFAQLPKLPEFERIETINAIRRELHKYSPFASEPVDCVQWVESETVTANDYNPNSVAPPEMELLRHSIAQDGYTQPIVSWKHGDTYEVVVSIGIGLGVSAKTLLPAFTVIYLWLLSTPNEKIVEIELRQPFDTIAPAENIVSRPCRISWSN
jgi:hypothetical protein